MAAMFGRKSQSSRGLEAGICKGDVGGRLGVWAVWNPKSSPRELFRVTLNLADRGPQARNFACSYTFGPSFNAPFIRSLEIPLAFKELLTGLQRVNSASVTIDFWFDNDQTVSLTLDLAEFLRVFRGKGKAAPAVCQVAPEYQVVDTAELAKLSRPELKAYSDKVRAELEEKRRKEEEERLAKEAAAKAAAEAAAKAAAAKAAKPAAAKGAEGEAAKPAEPTLKPAKTGIFYGTSTGNTEDIASQLKNALGDSVDYVKNITDIVPKDLTMVENLILGVPTWHIGEMQDDWAAVLPELDSLNFAGKKVAVFGLGDQKGYPDTYVDAMGELLEKFEKTGAKLHGLWPTEGYNFTKSKGMRDGKFLGLVIDIENQADQTDKRVKAWAAQIRKELGL